MDQIILEIYLSGMYIVILIVKMHKKCSGCYVLTKNNVLAGNMHVKNMSTVTSISELANIPMITLWTILFKIYFQMSLKFNLYALINIQIYVKKQKICVAESTFDIPTIMPLVQE